MNLRLDFISHADATKAIRRWYYRPDMPVGKLVRFGAWEVWEGETWTRDAKPIFNPYEECTA